MEHKIRNAAKERMAKGGVAIGLSVRAVKSVDIGLFAATADFDWLFIDCEHGALDLGTVAEIATAALGQGVAPIVRVPGKEHHHASRVLDNGALGVVVPHVENEEEAIQVANNTRFPPVGHRSISRSSALFGFRNIPIPEFVEAVNDVTLVCVMLESPNAISNADAIAAVPGIDAVMIGTNDFCAEAGIGGQLGHDMVVDAYETVIAACRKHGKYAGMGGVGTNDLMEKYVSMGAQFLLGGADQGFIISGGTERTKFLRGVNGK